MKRVFDIVISAICLLLFLPIIIVISCLILFYLGRPIFFCQERPGLHAKPFKMIKFRTMKSALDASGASLPDAMRITKFGSFLRSTSLDELPELWNVLKGEMSLVGPRPLLLEYLPLYDEEQSRRHDVKPGVTGWAQVNGRNAISWHDKFKLDIWYIDNQSFFLDLRILFITFKKIFVREGINAEGHVTIEKFKGNKH